jgi:hypothetical protein
MILETGKSKNTVLASVLDPLTVSLLLHSTMEDIAWQDRASTIAWVSSPLLTKLLVPLWGTHPHDLT